MSFVSPGINPVRQAALALAPATIVLCALAMPLPLSMKLAGYWLMPNLPLLAIFLWTMYRPDLLSPFVVLLGGLLVDLLIHAPLGASSLAYLAAYVLVATQRIFWLTLAGPGIFMGFTIVAFASGAVAWLAVSFAHGRLISPVPAVLEVIVTVAVFPLARRMFGPLERLAGPA